MSSLSNLLVSRLFKSLINRSGIILMLFFMSTAHAGDLVVRVFDASGDNSLAGTQVEIQGTNYRTCTGSEF